MKQCSLKNCQSKNWCKGYCVTHYGRWYRWGDPLKVTRERHGMYKSKEYKAWSHMLDRCRNKRCKSYPSYGGRGITVCNEWNSYTKFYKDMGSCPNKYSLDRINNDGNYEPSNCKWSTASDQLSNRRAYGKSGFRGVHLGSNGKYYVRLMKDGIVHQLGNSFDITEAIQIRKAGEQRLMEQKT